MVEVVEVKVSLSAETLNMERHRHRYSESPLQSRVPTLFLWDALEDGVDAL